MAVPESKPKVIRGRRGVPALSDLLNESNAMPCITVPQPWAWAMFALDADGRAIQRYENRILPLKIAGPTLIHTGAASMVDGQARVLLPELTYQQERLLPYGSIVGIVDVGPPQLASDLPPGTRLAHGPICYELRNPRAFQYPIKYPGRRGRFLVPNDLVAGEIANAEGRPLGDTELRGWFAAICSPMKQAIDALNLAESVCELLEPATSPVRDALHVAIEGAEMHAATQQAMETPTLHRVVSALHAARCRDGFSSLSVEAIEFEIMETIAGLITGGDLDAGLSKVREHLTVLRERKQSSRQTTKHMAAPLGRETTRYSTILARDPDFSGPVPGSQAAPRSDQET